MLSDGELWDSFLTGDNEAFKLIYEKSVSDLYAYGNRISPNRELVKDCIQDLFVELHRTRSRLGQTDRIMPYLMVSLKHLIVKKIQREKLDKYLDIDQLPFSFELGEDEKAVTDENNTDVLQMAIDRLPPRQREAVYLKYVLDFDYQELSKMLNLSYQASRNLIYRAISKLRESLKVEAIVLFTLFIKTIL